MKKLLMIISVLMLISFSNVFAKNGLEIGIFVPLGLSVGIDRLSYTNKKPNPDDKKEMDKFNQFKTNFNNFVKKHQKKSHAGFDAGVLVHIGYRFEINRDMSFSLLGELGYSHDSFNFHVNDVMNKDKSSVFSYHFESLVFGIYPKFNYKKFSFGLAFGIKVPLYANVISSYKDYKNNYIDQYVNSINAFQMKHIFNIPIIPYLKFSADYSIYENKYFAMLIGAYIGGDFGMSLKNPRLTLQDSHIKRNISSFDIGFQLGMRFLPAL